MNVKIVFSTFLICWMCYRSSAVCGNRNLVENIGWYDYERYGKRSSEFCKWNFNVPEVDNTIVIVDIIKFSAFRKGTAENAFLTLPNNKKVHFYNRREYIGNCMRFVKRNQTSNKCTDALADRYCSNPTIEVDEWPPSLTSTAKTSFRENNNTYSYDMDFTFFYMYVNCPKLEDDPIHEEDSNATTYFTTTVTVGILLVLVLFATVISLGCLVKKTREARESAEALKNERRPPHSSSNSEEQDNEDVYENPNFAVAVDNPSTGARHPYYQIDMPHPQQQRHSNASKENHRIQVVSNILYEM